MNRRTAKRVLRYACLLATCHLSLATAFATTVTGKLLDPAGVAIANGQVKLVLANYGIGNIPRIPGTNLIVQTSPVVFTTGADGSFSGFIQGNDLITPVGTYYQVT